MAPVLISVPACDSAPRLARAGGLRVARGRGIRAGGEHLFSPLPEAAWKVWLT